MNCYIIPVGGTGIRVMRALIHLMASGVLTNLKGLNDIHFMLVDSDSTNGDKTRLEQTIKNYMDIYQVGVVSKKLVKPFADPDFTWSPLDAGGKSMAEIEGYDIMDEDMKKLFDFLYTNEEKNKKLNGGFYSHTSIGSYYMANGITNQAGEYIGRWNEFFGDITKEDKIIIICSMFGGTGASGVPTLARRIREANATQKCDIAGIFIEPYFESVNRNNENKIIDTNSFPIKSKIAFEYYYNQKFDKEIFNRMYFVGENPGKMMKVKHNIDSENQKNKANVVELYAATAVIEFLSHYDTLGAETVIDHEAIKFPWRGNSEDDFVFDKKLLNMVGGAKIFDKIARFMQFSVIYTKFFYYCIIKDDARRCRFLKYYNFKDDASKEGVEVLYNYCKKYMEWIREMITEAKNNGEFSFRWLSDPYSADNKYTEWFVRTQFELYDSNEISEKVYLDKCVKLDKVYNDENPGFTHMVKGKTSYSAEHIFTCLCSQPRPKVIKSLKLFVRDVLMLIERGKLAD